MSSMRHDDHEVTEAVDVAREVPGAVIGADTTREETSKDIGNGLEKIILGDKLECDVKNPDATSQELSNATIHESEDQTPGAALDEKTSNATPTLPSPPPVTLFCRPDGLTTVCHPCRLRGNYSKCKWCDQDLKKVVIFETLPSLTPTTNLTGHGSESSSQEEPRGILFCQNSDLCHTCMIRYGWANCAYCSMDFTKLSQFCYVPEYPPEEMEKTDEEQSQFEETSDDPRVSGYSSGESEGKEKPQVATSDDITPDIAAKHSVEYLFANDVSIGKVPLSERFDLAKARLLAKGTRKSPSFELITKVSTSMDDTDNYWYQKLEGDLSRIVKNKNIDLKIQTTTLAILSKDIIQGLSDVVSYYPSVQLGGQKLVLEEPYSIIAHHLKPLELLRSSNNDLNLFMNFVQDSIFKDYIEQEQIRNANGMCSFRMLWLIFKPGDTIYTELHGEPLAFVISSVKSPDGILSSSTTMAEIPPYELIVWNLDFDGSYVGRCEDEIRIEPFEGERNISTLKTVPCQFKDGLDGGAHRRRLEELGRQWYELLPGRSIQYLGITEDKKRLDGRVYVDSSSYYAQHGLGVQPKSWPGARAQSVSGARPRLGDIDDTGRDRAMSCTCPICKGMRSHPPPGFRWALYDVLDPTSDAHKSLENPESPEGPRHRYLLASRKLYGLALKTRKWESLYVEHCLPSRANLSTFEKLVMADDRKDMIKALVHNFTTSESPKDHPKPWAADFIESKGEGKIFLLHGGPGLGKTYTAECIAEYTGRPLVSLTAGDIGTDEFEMEKKLSEWFQLAEKWGAVMLIDEADVYLEQRHRSDLQRNSLVSVFLRSVEYYKGILFLTTNRVGTFDDAFVSRIHVVIKYDQLNKGDRGKIWKMFFDKLEEEREDFAVASRAKDYVLADEVISEIAWNGREIRNIFQTAVSLAEFRFSQDSTKSRPTLEKKDFEQVCAMTRQFKQYLDGLHGADEESRAAIYRNRAAVTSENVGIESEQVGNSQIYTPRPRS